MDTGERKKKEPNDMEIEVETSRLWKEKTTADRVLT